MVVITKLSSTQLDSIAKSLNLQLYGLQSHRRRDGRWQHRFVLRPCGKEFRRRGFVRRTIWAVCWHGHYDFLERLFASDPDAVVRSSLATYRGVGEFKLKAIATGDRRVGSLLNPYLYRELCSCYDDD